MPLIIPKDLPAYEKLLKENVFLMDAERAKTQDIRPLEVAILNLMPKKIETETHLLRMISNTALQVNIDLIRTKSHNSKNTSKAHLDRFYITIDDVKDKKYDALIITGAPVELLEYEHVNYWDELVSIMEFARTNVYSTMFICWAAQAAMYHYYGLKKDFYKEKLFGVFSMTLKKLTSLTRGFDDHFYAPHSRYTYVTTEEIEKIDEIEILACSPEVGVHLAATKDNRFIFVSGHGEYSAKTLDREYKRDLEKGLDIEPPKNYYKNDNPKEGINIRWMAHSNLLFSNWLNYCVYQETPYDLNNIEANKIKK